MAGEWLALFRSLSEDGPCSDSSDSSDSSPKKGSIGGNSHKGRAIEAFEAIGTKAAEEIYADSETNAGVARRREAAAWTASDWRDFFEERAAFRQYDASCNRAEAERLAWSELQNRWHFDHGARAPRDLCAGCRRPIGNELVIDMVDGNRVHDGVDHPCLIQHGSRWRAAATRGLLEMGLKQPIASGRAQRGA
jgi:hypothetical protein